MRLRFAHGFSLIELMIVLAIMGIVVMFAYPSYTKYVLKSRRIEAKSGLLELAQKQEDYRADNNTYANSVENLWKDTEKKDDLFLFKKYSTRPNDLEDLNYGFSATGDAKGFTLSAEAYSDRFQVGDLECKVFTIDRQGTRSAKNSEGTDNPDCWK